MVPKLHLGACCILCQLNRADKTEKIHQTYGKRQNITYLPLGRWLFCRDQAHNSLGSSIDRIKRNLIVVGMTLFDRG